MTKMKWFVALTLIILVAGLAVFGFLGFNNSVDYSKSYEIHVKLEQNIDTAKQTMKTTAEKFFADKGIKVVSSQMEDDGVGIIYKLTSEQSAEKVAELENLINAELDKAQETKGNKVSASINVVDAKSSIQPLNAIIAYAVAILLIFIYMLIMNKFASAVAVICSSVLSLLTFIALVALTRIPAAPYFRFMVLFASMLSTVLSVLIVGGYKEELKSAEKISNGQIVNKVAIDNKKKFLFALIIMLVVAIAFALFMTPYMLILGGQIAIAGLVAVVVSYFFTPLLWLAIKGNK